MPITQQSLERYDNTFLFIWDKWTSETSDYEIRLSNSLGNDHINILAWRESSLVNIRLRCDDVYQIAADEHHSTWGALSEAMSVTGDMKPADSHWHVTQQ